MRNFNIQLFAAEAVHGSKIVYLYRILKNAATKTACALAFTTENSYSKSKDSDSTVTKDGAIRVPGEAEIEITATSILAKGDSLVKELEDAMDNDELIEIWEANLEEPVEGGNNKFAGKYFQGYLTSLEKASNAEDFVEISLTFAVNGNGVSGDVTVNEEQQEIAAYVFKDTTATGA